MKNKRFDAGDSSDESALRQIIDREREMETWLLEAQAETDRIVEKARAEAKRMVTGALQEWERQAEAAREALASRTRARAEERIATFRTLTQRLDALDGARLEILAARVLTEIFPELEEEAGGSLSRRS